MEINFNLTFFTRWVGFSADAGRWENQHGKGFFLNIEGGFFEFEVTTGP